jgi:hypothetical protein
LSGELKRVSLEVLVKDGFEEVLKDVILDALANKGLATPQSIAFTGETVAKDIKIAKAKNLIIAYDEVLDEGTPYNIKKVEPDERLNLTNGLKYGIVKYKFDKGERKIVESGIIKGIKVIDLKEESDKVRMYLGDNHWNIYNVLIAQQKGSSEFQIIVGREKPGKFALEWIDEEFKKCFELFLANKLEYTREEFDAKRTKYFKYFLNKLKKIKERTKHIPLFSAFVEVVRENFRYYNSSAYGKELMDKINILIMDLDEVDMFMDFFAERLNPKDVVQALDLGGEDYKLSDDNSYYMIDFYSYVYKKFGLLTDEEVHVLKNQKLYPYAITTIVRANIYSVAQTESKFRLKSDSWNYHVFKNAWTTIANQQSEYNRLHDNYFQKTLTQEQKELMLTFIENIILRYATCKEFPMIMKTSHISGEYAERIIPFIYESLNTIKGLEKLTLTSIISSDMVSPILQNGIRIFDDRLLPKEFTNIRKTIMEVKLKR